MNLRDSVLLTLIYHDIFDYPLNIDEINKYLIKNVTNTSGIKKMLKVLIRQNRVGEKDGYFYLKGRKKIVQTRKKRINISKNKHKKAKFYSSLLKILPTVKLIGVTGALAMDNSTKNDDIDILIITAKNALWMTRLFVNLLLFPYKRKPTSKKQKDKACLNIFIDESDLTIKDQTLYTAHELVQLKPVFDRNNTYLKLMKKNDWVNEYLPNFKPKAGEGVKSKFKFPVPNIVETASKFVQLNYMRSKITTEKIGDTQLFFHPSPTQNVILTKYKKRLKRFKLKFPVCTLKYPTLTPLKTSQVSSCLDSYEAF